MVCGQDIGLVREIRPIAEIIAGMVEEAEAVMERRAGREMGTGPGAWEDARTLGHPGDMETYGN